jgi:hypothetical protein
VSSSRPNSRAEIEALVDRIAAAPELAKRLREERYLMRAAFYGMWLRAQGFETYEAAHLVIDRYPRAERMLRQLLIPRGRVADPLQDRREERETEERV